MLWDLLLYFLLKNTQFSKYPLHILNPPLSAELSDWSLLNSDFILVDIYRTRPDLQKKPLIG